MHRCRCQNYKALIISNDWSSWGTWGESQQCLLFSLHNSPRPLRPTTMGIWRSIDDITEIYVPKMCKYYWRRRRMTALNNMLTTGGQHWTSWTTLYLQLYLTKKLKAQITAILYKQRNSCTIIKYICLYIDTYKDIHIC